MKKFWWAFIAKDRQTIYALGSIGEAELYLEQLNGERETGLYAAYALSDEEVVEKQLDDFHRSFDLRDILAVA